MKKINKMKRHLIKVKNNANDLYRMMEINKKDPYAPYFSDQEIAETKGAISFHGFMYRLMKEMIAKYGQN